MDASRYIHQGPQAVRSKQRGNPRTARRLWHPTQAGPPFLVGGDNERDVAGDMGRRNGRVRAGLQEADPGHTKALPDTRRQEGRCGLRACRVEMSII